MTDPMPSTDTEAPAPRDLQLRGNRFSPLRYEDMTPAQRQMVDSVLNGKRGSMQGPYNVLLRSPEMGNLAQAFGVRTRFDSSLPLHLNELAILTIARFWRCDFVWWAHRNMATNAGLPEATIQAVLTGVLPAGTDAAERVVYDFCRQLVKNRKVDAPSHAALVGLFGERGAVDLIGAMGYYSLVCLALNADQYPLPDGVVGEVSGLGD